MAGSVADAGGRQPAQELPRKADAERFLTRIEASKLDANYIDPAAGRVTFGAFATAWLAAQTFDASTREAVASRLRVHLLPAFGDVEIRHMRHRWCRSGCGTGRSAPRPGPCGSRSPTSPASSAPLSRTGSSPETRAHRKQSGHQPLSRIG
ncbi:MAG: hypothetical protein ACRD2W_14115 [Acidimicrobiales bacterium]